MALLGCSNKQLIALQRGKLHISTITWRRTNGKREIPIPNHEIEYTVKRLTNFAYFDGAQEFEKMKEKNPENFRLDFAVSREQTNAKGEKMYIQTRMAEYAEELWEMLKKDNTYVYMCGLKGMEKGIDDIMVSLAAKDGK